MRIPPGELIPDLSEPKGDGCAVALMALVIAFALGQRACADEDPRPGTAITASHPVGAYVAPVPPHVDGGASPDLTATLPGAWRLERGGGGWTFGSDGSFTARYEGERWRGVWAVYHDSVFVSFDPIGGVRSLSIRAFDDRTLEIDGAIARRQEGATPTDDMPSNVVGDLAAVSGADTGAIAMVSLDRVIISKNFPERTAFLGTVPVFHRPVDAAINGAIRNELEKALRVFVDELQLLPLPDPALPLSFAVQSEVHRDDDEYLSVSLKVTYYGGGAHEMYVTRSVLFSRREQRTVGIVDLLDHAGLARLASRTAAALRRELGASAADIRIRDATAPNPLNYATFTLEASGADNEETKIVVYFNPYRVASYSQGSFEIAVLLPGRNEH